MADRDKVTPQGKAFFKELEVLAKLQVRVGFTAGASGKGRNQEAVTADDYSEGPTVAEVAAWNELGTAHSPPRPFLRQSVEKNAEKIKKMVRLQFDAIAKGGTAEVALNAIGALQVGFVQAEIKNGGFEPNAPSTVRIKTKGKGGATVPLIDTGRMRQSVHYVIEEKGKGDG